MRVAAQPEAGAFFECDGAPSISAQVGIEIFPYRGFALANTVFYGYPVGDVARHL